MSPQGMFSEGLPHGVGQVVYSGGAARDAGLWWRGQLVRILCTSPTGVPFDSLLTGHYIGWYDRRVLHVQVGWEDGDCAAEKSSGH